MGFGPNGQEHGREGSHRDLGKLGLGSLLVCLPPGYDSANHGCDKINCLTCSFMLFIFRNIELECNCMK